MSGLSVSVDVVPWVRHSGQCLYSIDIDALGWRVATAGSDSMARVWRLAPILSAAAEEDEGRFPRLLATLNAHLHPINTVRFSHSGKFLATCSDDKLVIIHELVPGRGRAVFGEQAHNLEEWKQQHTLRGHSNNVIDVEWSPDDSLLASCSLDNNVIVWSSSGQQVAVLEGHSSHTKGVAWDPVGTYLASQSDDRTIIVWRCSDWARVAQTGEPFATGSVRETFSLRLSWTTEGASILVVNSLQKPSHCVCVVNRERWNADYSVVGHAGAVTVVRMNPLLFEDPDSQDPCPCFALGAQDQRVTVWLGASNRPVGIFSKVFSQSVTDVAWTPDGHTLLACSSDGSVASVRFEKGVFGNPVTKAAKAKYIAKLYGDRTASNPVLPETSTLLDVDRSRTKDPLEASLQLPAQPPGVAAPAGKVGKPPAGPPARNALDRILPPSNQPGLSARLSVEGSQGVTKPRRITPQQMNGTPAVQERARMAPNHALGSPKGHRVPRALPASAALTIELGQVVDELRGSRERSWLDIGNEAATGTCTIVCKRGGASVWKEHLRGAVYKAAGNLNFCAVAMMDGTIHVYSPAGRRLDVGSLKLGQPPTRLLVGSGWELAVVSSEGLLQMWDVQARRCLAKAPLPKSTLDVVQARLSEKGKPLVILADGSAYVLNMQMEAWICAVDPEFAVSAFTSRLPGSQQPGELGRIEVDASAAGRAQALSGGLASAGMGTESSMRHLECKVAAALALETPQEYKRWLMSYVRHLAGEQKEEALREVIDPLQGPIRGHEGWSDSILGLSKRSLLKDVLKEVARHRSMQRLVTEARDQLLESEAPGDGSAPGSPMQITNG